MYQSVCGVYDHHKISKGVTESVLVKQIKTCEITTAPWEKMSLTLRVVPLTRRKDTEGE
jgi:hypothetical protein